MKFNTILLTIFLFSAALNGCIMQTRNKQEFLNQAAVEDFIGAKIPGNATNMKFSQQQGLDTIFYLRFNLSPSELMTFLQELGFKRSLRDLFPIVPTVSSGGRPDWWIPDQLSTYAAEEDIIHGKVYQVVVDKTDPNNWVVYMLVSTQ